MEKDGFIRRLLVEEMIHALARIDRIEAIVLGGSYARETAQEDSDVDLWIYYFEKFPPSLANLKGLSKRFDNPQDCVMTDFYEWGPWVNEGA